MSLKQGLEVADKPVDERYLERLMTFKEKLSKQKAINLKKRQIKKRYYEKNRAKILGKKKKKYCKDGDLTKE